MSRRTKIAVGALAALVFAGVLYLPALYHRVLGLARLPNSEAVERRAVVAPPVLTATDAPVKAQMFWASNTPGRLEPTERELRLSADPVKRGRQLLAALVADAPSAEARTLPASASVLEFYLLPGGIAVADFSSELATEMPSGILSEELAVESIADTLAANIPDLRELKILIDGREANTLAGHIDLTGYFLLRTPRGGSPAAGDAPAPDSPGTTGERQER